MSDNLTLTMRFGYTAHRGALPTKAICFAGKGAWSHSLIVFEWRDAQGVVVKTDYYESRSTPISFIARSGERKDIESGLRGPLPIEKLYAWHQEDPRKHRFIIQDVLGHSEADAYRALKMLDDRIEGWVFDPEKGRMVEAESKYARLQIYKNSKFLLIGNAGWVSTRTPFDITCCEIQIYCVNDRCWKWLGLGVTYLADESFPSGRKGHGGNYENMERWNRYVKDEVTT